MSKLSRRLVVLLHADVVSSTQLVQTNDLLTHRQMQREFQDLSREIELYGGKTRELRGDALVAEFNRASDAVSAALLFQSKKASREGDEIALYIRIGISIGEVIVADGTITGAGVILAQRLEQVCSPGGVVVQGSVAESVPKQFPFVYKSLGELDLKGFDQPIKCSEVSLLEGADVPISESLLARPGKRNARGLGKWLLWLLLLIPIIIVLVAFSPFNYLLPKKWTEPWLTQEPTSVSAGKPTIAVLPFANLGQPDNDYFADGITDDLITDLSGIDSLFVINRSSTFLYKDKEVDIRDVANELSARYILTGRIRHADDQVRINVELNDSIDGSQIWAERYDREIVNIFDLQDEITGKILNALSLKLSRQEKHILEQRATDNLEAYDLHQQGRALIFSSQRESARELLYRAVELDPDYSDAYASIAFSLAIDVSFGLAKNQEEQLEEAFTVATKAVSMGSRSAAAQYALAMTFLLRGQHEESKRASLRALEINPNYASGHAMYSWAEVLSNNYAESLDGFSKAIRLQPTSHGIILGVQGGAYYMLERYDEAATILELSIEQNPNTVTAHVFLAATYQRLGRLDDASWEMEETLVINPEFRISEWNWVRVFKNPQDASVQRFIEDLKQAGFSYD